MPIVFPPVYLDPPAIIRVAAHSSGAGRSFAAASPLTHLNGSITRLQGVNQGPAIVTRPQPVRDPQGFSSGPDTATSPQPSPQPLGFSSGPDAATSPQPSAQPLGFSSGPDVATRPR
jgi:hypothetical protein